jgi:choline dehydrogenase
MEFDHIIVGGGAAGCLMANRLSETPSTRVLLLEAGGKDDWIWFHIPVGYLFAIGNPRADWMFETEPEPGLNGRKLAYPRGRVIGGSTAINAMIYSRGLPSDYDAWRQAGLAGWGWDDVAPLFRRHEDHVRSDDPNHGSGGEWRVEEPRMRWRVLDAFAEACAGLGMQRLEDLNASTGARVGYFHVNQKRGRRWSAARGFLKPALGRPNLRVELNALAERVVIEGGRAVGVAWTRGGEQHVSRARGEVILCAGAVQSPKLLELSGVGDGARLQGMGIAVQADRPGVGENLQDHLQLRPIYRVSGVATLNEQYAQVWRRPLMALDYALRRRGPMTMAPSQMGAFLRSGPEVDEPNLQIHAQPLSLDRFGEPLHTFPAITLSICNLRPESRGSIHAASPDPRAAPRIAPNYLSTPGDRRIAAASLRRVREIVAREPLAGFAPQEVRPGAHLVSDEELEQAAGDIGTTIFHPVGTARMGRGEDRNAVLDERLRVIGVAGLRVIDASVMPTIPSGNTASPTLMIAEKGAAMVREDARR